MPQGVDWSQYWQPILQAAVPVIVAFLGLIAAVFGGAAFVIGSNVRNNARREGAYLDQQKANNEELALLRKDQRDADKRLHEAEKKEDELRTAMAQLKEQRDERGKEVERLTTDIKALAEKMNTELTQVQTALADVTRLYNEAMQSERSRTEELQREREAKDLLKKENDELRVKVTDLERRVRELEVKNGTSEQPIVSAVTHEGN